LTRWKISRLKTLNEGGIFKDFLLKNNLVEDVKVEEDLKIEEEEGLKIVVKLPTEPLLKPPPLIRAPTTMLEPDVTGGMTKMFQ
jgi:hypothetical protein